MTFGMFMLYMLGAFYLMANLICLICCEVDDSWEEIPRVLNPVAIYKNVKVNYFGCFVLTLVHNIILLPFSICYWLYKLGWLFWKLCTIGRE